VAATLSEYMSAQPSFADEKFIAAYVDENQDYYIAKFNLVKEGKSYTGFNLAALIFPTIWFTYRKLYIYAFVYLILQQVILTGGHHILLGMASIQHAPRFVQPLIINLTISIFNVVASLNANKIYLLRANQIINKLSATTTNEAALLEACKKSGGGNNFACFLLILALLIINLSIQYAKFT